ncbi:MAG: lysine--tRNA ligase [Candidatus Harrisonbacteria bacterium]|nr:lysine--tRNA ligase [Candidatus Harrisonbacteria bacterium]
MLEDLIKERLKKRDNLIKAGYNPYPAKAAKRDYIGDVLRRFFFLSLFKKAIFIGGRITGMRIQGGVIFLDIQDESGKIQAVLTRKKVPDFQIWKDNLDIGDFVIAQGTLFKTKKGEKSVDAQKLIMATKSIRPLPAAWYGFHNEEERLRKRYLDMIFNPAVKDLVGKKAKFWNATRTFLTDRGFMEVETPVLETTPGGADARPFITHHNALDIDVYLRISMGELWQKRLMVAGFEKTFEIGRQFRNEGMDAEHLQDYTQMEFYWAYADYEMGMKLVEELYKYIAMKAFGTLKFTIGDFKVDLDREWVRYNYRETVKKYTGVDILNTNLEEIQKKLNELKIEYDRKGFNLTRAIDNLWKYCRRQIPGPGFLVGAPVEVSPLAKKDEKNPELTQRFQVIIAGSELGNGYSELNDPIEQEQRFDQQMKLREAGDEEAQMKDEDFVEALGYGMPPTCGFGMSERVFSFLANKTARECQTFPLMKLKKIIQPF